MRSTIALSIVVCIDSRPMMFSGAYVLFCLSHLNEAWVQCLNCEEKQWWNGAIEAHEAAEWTGGVPIPIRLWAGLGDIPCPFPCLRRIDSHAFGYDFSSDSRIWGASSAPSVKSGREPQPKTNLVHFGPL